MCRTAFSSRCGTLRPSRPICASTYAQYGEGLDGFGQFLQRNDSHLSAVLYRALEYAHPNPIAALARLVPPVATAS